MTTHSISVTGKVTREWTYYALGWGERVKDKLSTNRHVHKCANTFALSLSKRSKCWEEREPEGRKVSVGKEYQR